MKKLLALVLVLGIASLSMAASVATISLVGPAAGEKGSFENPLLPSETCIIKIVSDGPVLADVEALLDGLASFAGATTKADGMQKYGWDVDFSAETVVGRNKIILSAGSFAGLGGPGKVIGEIIVHCDGEDLVPVIVGIKNGDVAGGSFDAVSYAPALFGLPVNIYQIPEPMTMSLLGMGALALIRRRRA